MPKRFEWDDILPRNTALHQRQWERRRDIIRMHQLGYTPDEIAERFNITRTRVYQIRESHENHVRRTGQPRPSPMEKFIAYNGYADKERLADIWIEPWDRKLIRGVWRR